MTQPRTRRALRVAAVAGHVAVLAATWPGWRFSAQTRLTMALLAAPALVVIWILGLRGRSDRRAGRDPARRSQPVTAQEALRGYPRWW